MTTTPTPTGKIRGSLREVMPKLRNFVGAVKVTTSSGKGGILVEMGKPVASYLTQDGVLSKGKASLDLLEKEQIAEFEILRYDDEQFREAMIICDNRGLLLPEGKVPPAGAPAPAREEKPRDENVLSSMMKRFATPKIVEKQEPVRVPPKAEPAAEPPTIPPPPPVVREEPFAGGPVVPVPEEKAPPAPEKREPAPAAVTQETDLSAIIKRLREPGKPAPEAEGRAKVPGPAPAPVVSVPPAAGEKAAAAAPAGAVTGAAAPPAEVPNGRVKVDLGKMMKRIKRLDITSIRRELEEGVEAPGSAGPAAPAEAGTPPAATAPAEPAPSPVEEKAKSDIDDLKAFIQRLEVLEQPPETPPPAEKGLLAKLGVKPRAEGAPVPAPKREVPAPVPVKEKVVAEEPQVAEVKPLEKPPEKKAPAPAPAMVEPDRKAKITSLLRRSGLVKPPAEEVPREPAPAVTPEPVAPPAPAVVKEEPPAPAEEAGIPVPRPQRKKVEITRVPKKPEKPLREPPLIDERMIQKILRQPGVIAVSTFFEGFAVQSAGRADFEQVAANAEDLFRAGTKIAREIDIGPLNQIILETGKGKLIIAPHGDLNVCVFTEPDANLGLIRVAIRGMQVEKD
jgi:predicted regulator of Ras-like GTPase activity (Roadblock/LC7/MglB family)